MHLRKKLGLIALSALILQPQSVYGATRRPIPQKNKLPITTKNFCSGEQNLLKKVKQPIQEEWGLLCQNGEPTALFDSMVTTAYDGTNTVNYRELSVGPSAANPGFVEVKVTYSLRLKKSAVRILRSEEALMGPNFPYKSPDLNISFRFAPPPAMEGDADTAFTVIQHSKRVGARSFDEESSHSLKLYRLIPNNFDFLLAARSLNAPTDLLKKATVLRATMTDPTDPAYGIVTTVMNFLVSDQEGQQDRVEVIFVNYIKADLQNVFKYHQSN